MFETDRLPKGWNNRLNKMDQIWVPSSFHVSTFHDGGVIADKLFVIGEPVDTEFYSPKNVKEALHVEDHFIACFGPCDTYNNKNDNNNNDSSSKKTSFHGFTFLSIFKWEERKGWDILLESFWKQFNKNDNVRLLLLTNAYHSSDNFAEPIQMLAEKLKINEHEKAPVYLLQSHLPQSLMPALYKAADSFVIASRGEGWGRPHVEAMSMSLPTIATNFSGNLQFMLPSNSYLIKLDGMKTISSGPFKGHKWANPSVNHLSELMRTVVDNKEEAIEVGKRARQHITSNYSPSILAVQVFQQLNKIIEASSSSTKGNDKFSVQHAHDEL